MAARPSRRPLRDRGSLHRPQMARRLEPVGGPCQRNNLGPVGPPDRPHKYDPDVDVVYPRTTGGAEHQEVEDYEQE